MPTKSDIEKSRTEEKGDTALEVLAKRPTFGGITPTGAQETMERSTTNLTPRLVTLPAFRDCRGSLCYVQDGDEQLPFAVKRVFWIYGVPPGQRRGFHAHRTCSELLFALHGSVDVEVRTALTVETYHLSDPRTGLVIPPMCWCSLSDFAADSVCLCLSDGHYDEQGYINDLQEWEREAGISR